MDNVTTIIIMSGALILAIVFLVLHGRTTNEKKEKLFAFLSGLCTFIAITTMFVNMFYDKDDKSYSSEYKSAGTNERDEEWIRTHHMDGSPRNPDKDWW